MFTLYSIALLYRCSKYSIIFTAICDEYLLRVYHILFFCKNFVSIKEVRNTTYKKEQDVLQQQLHINLVASIHV